MVRARLLLHHLYELFREVGHMGGIVGQDIDPPRGDARSARTARKLQHRLPLRMQHSADKPASVWPVPAVQVCRESPVHQFADQMLKVVPQFWRHGDDRAEVVPVPHKIRGIASSLASTSGLDWVLFDQFLKCSLLLKHWTHVSTQCLIPASDAMEFLRQIGDVDLPG